MKTIKLLELLHPSKSIKYLGLTSDNIRADVLLQKIANNIHLKFYDGDYIVKENLEIVNIINDLRYYLKTNNIIRFSSIKQIKTSHEEIYEKFISLKDVVFVTTCNRQYKITDLVKDSDFGSTSNRHEIENRQIENINDAILKFNKPIKIQNVLYDAVLATKVSGVHKADFCLVDKNSNAICYISHKALKHQQWGGMSNRKNSGLGEYGLGGKLEYIELKNFVLDVSLHIEKNPCERVCRKILNKDLINKIVYGRECGINYFSSENVQYVIHGEILLNVTNDYIELHTEAGGIIYNNSDNLKDEHIPVLSWRPGHSRPTKHIKTGRLMAMPTSYLKNVRNI